MKKLILLVIVAVFALSVMSCCLKPKYDYDVWVTSYVDENYMIIDRYTYDSSGILLSSNLNQYVYDSTYHYKHHECSENYLRVRLYIECWWLIEGSWYWDYIELNSYLNPYNLSDDWSITWSSASKINLTAEK